MQDIIIMRSITKQVFVTAFFHKRGAVIMELSEMKHQVTQAAAKIQQFGRSL